MTSLPCSYIFLARVCHQASRGLETEVQILQPLTFAFLLIGSMLPYWVRWRPLLDSLVSFIIAESLFVIFFSSREADCHSIQKSKVA